MKRPTSLRTFAHMIEGAIGVVMLALYGLSNLPVPDTHVDTNQTIEQQQVEQQQSVPPFAYRGRERLKACLNDVEAYHATKPQLDYYTIWIEHTQHYDELDLVTLDYFYQNNVDYYNPFAIRYTCDSNGLLKAEEIGLTYQD